MQKKMIILMGIYLMMILIFCIKPTYAKYVIQTETNLNVEISIDKEGPIIQIKDINNEAVSNYGTAIGNMKISYYDNLSGIGRVTYKYNSNQKEFSNIQEITLNNNETLEQEGWYEIIAIDKAQNKTIMDVYVSDAVARIEQVYYKTLADAIQAVPSNQVKKTIVMLKNVTENNTIPIRKKILLDLNNTTITGNFRINSMAVLEIQNGTVNNTFNSPTFYNLGTLNINNGTYTCNSTSVVESRGTLYIKGGILKNSGSGNVVQIDLGIAYLSGGEYVGNSNISAIIKIKGGTLNLKGANITSGFANVNTLKQTGGAVNFTSGSIVCTYKETEARAVQVSSDSARFIMSGGTISGYTGNMCAFEGKCTVELTGGTIQNLGNSEFTSAISVYYGAEVTIDGTSINKTVSGRTIYIDSGTVNFKSGKISSISFTGDNCECIEISDDTDSRTEVVANLVMSGGTATANGASPVIRVRKGGSFVITRWYGYK